MATAGERAAILKGVFRLDELDEIRERATTCGETKSSQRSRPRRAERFTTSP